MRTCYRRGGSVFVCIVGRARSGPLEARRGSARGARRSAGRRETRSDGRGLTAGAGIQQTLVSVKKKEPSNCVRRRRVIGLTHHELIVVLQQKRPFRRVQGGRDLLRLDGEVLGDLRSTGRGGARSVDARIQGRSNKKGGGCGIDVSTRSRVSDRSHRARVSRSRLVPGRRPRPSSCPCPWRAVSRGRSRAGESAAREAAAPVVALFPNEKSGP